MPSLSSVTELNASEALILLRQTEPKRPKEINPLF